MNAKQYYVYVHCRPSGEPFYVGLGQNGRAYNLHNRNKYHRNIVRKYGSENILIYTYLCDSRKYAIEYEIFLIAWCRKQKFKMANVTDGGDGVHGWRPSESTRAVWRAQRKGKLLGNKHRLGDKHSEETRKKMSIAGKGRTWTPEHRANHAAAMAVSNRERIWSEESRLKAARGSMGNKNLLGHRHWLDRKHTEESKQKMRLTNKRLQGAK